MEFSRIAICFAASLAVQLSAAFAQTPEATPEGDAPKSSAHIRVWAMVYGEKSPFTVRSETGDDQPVTLLQGKGDAPQRDPYVDVKNGKVKIVLLSGGAPIKTEEIDLLPNDYRTVVVSRKGGSLAMDILQDPLPGQKNFVPAARLFNFGTDRTMEVSFGPQKAQVSPDSFQVIPLSGSGNIPIKVSLPDPKGGYPALSETDIDLAAHPSWSLVAIPDYRGKLRPRVSPDGQE